MVILSLCGDKYNKPSDKPEDMTVLDRMWKRAVARLAVGRFDAAGLTVTRVASALASSRSRCAEYWARHCARVGAQSGPSFPSFRRRHSSSR